MWSGLGLLLLVVFICEFQRYVGDAAPVPTQALPAGNTVIPCKLRQALCAAGVAAAELIQDLETDVGAFFLTYFSAGLFALWVPVVFFRARLTRSCTIRSRQRYELLPQGEDGAEAAVAEQCEDSEHEDDVQDGRLMPQTTLASVAGPAECTEMLRLGLLFGPLWFFANWTYNASLELTSVRSEAILEFRCSV